MAQPLLNLPDVGSAVQLICRERLAETVQSPLLTDRVGLAVHLAALTYVLTPIAIQPSAES